MKMNAKEKLERANKLINLYGSLLTKKELKIMIDKYQYDLSYSEIASKYKISRAAALSFINSGYKKLEYYEGKLGLLSKLDKCDKLLSLSKDKKLIKELREIYGI